RPFLLPKDFLADRAFCGPAYIKPGWIPAAERRSKRIVLNGTEYVPVQISLDLCARSIASQRTLMRTKPSLPNKISTMWTVTVVCWIVVCWHGEEALIALSLDLVFIVLVYFRCVFQSKW